MKKIILFAALTFTVSLFSQFNSSQPIIAQVGFDLGNYGNIPFLEAHIQNELIKTKMYQVLDKYDLNELESRNINITKNCFSTRCLSKLCDSLPINFLFLGSINQIDKKTIVNLRIFNKSNKQFEKNHIKEFITISGQELNMITLTLQEMLGINLDPILNEKLTKFQEFDSEVNNPYQPSLNTKGPRMGMVLLTGEMASIIKAPTSKGGFNGAPYAFQFGYQFEKQYLNSGNFQALFEFIPMITGMDQGLLQPSFTLLNGLRNNVNGWEFAIGPSFSIVKTAEGSIDNNGNWVLKNDLPAGNSYKIEKRMDSRGDIDITTSLIISVGKTFKSGKMNLPLNVFYSPHPKSPRFGISLGWNSKPRFK